VQIWLIILFDENMNDVATHDLSKLLFNTFSLTFALIYQSSTLISQYVTLLRLSDDCTAYNLNDFSNLYIKQRLSLLQNAVLAISL